MDVNKMTKAGGRINMKDGVILTIPQNSLKKEMAIQTQKIIYDDRVTIHLEPSGLKFKIPAILEVSKKFLDGIGRVDKEVLIGPGDVQRYYGDDMGDTLQYKLDHFSIYYYRRR